LESEEVGGLFCWLVGLFVF